MAFPPVSRWCRALAFLAATVAAPLGATIHDVRGLYSFGDNLNSYWPIQPPLVASGFTASYVTSTMPDGFNARALSVPALDATKALVLTNWAQSNGGSAVNGGGAATRTNRWTLVMDIRPSFAAGTTWTSLLQTNGANDDDGEIFLNTNGSIFAGGGIAPAGTVPNNTWSRLAFVCSNDGVGGPLTLKVFRNGTLVGTSAAQAFNNRFSLAAFAYLLADDNNETNPCLLGSIACWTESLSDTDILLMGGPKGTGPEIQWSSMPAAAARPGLSGKLKFGSFELDLPASGFVLGSGTVLLSPGRATVAGQPNYSLSGTRSIRLAANGDLFYVGGTTSLEVSGSPWIQVNNVTASPGGVTLTATGATADSYRVKLPIGMGVAVSANSRRLVNTANIGSQPLDSGLRPSSGARSLIATHFGIEAGTNLRLSFETMPLRYSVPEITWAPSTGAFLIPAAAAGNVAFERASERTLMKEWTAIAGVTGDSRPSNDDYFAAAGGAAQTIVDTNADGQPRIREMDQLFNGGPANGFVAHYPRGVAVTWQSGGTSRLRYASSVRQTDSYLYEGLGAQLAVARACPDTGCPAAGLAGPKTFSFVPPDHWLFTRDGGLYAPVTLSGTADARSVEWGSIDGAIYAHRIDTPFSAGSVLIPGQTLRATDAPGVSLQNRPAALLLSGHGNGTSPDPVERPGSAGYATGAADYPGLNLRLPTDGAAQATSRLGGTALSYPLRSRSKYVLRPAGVTGIHEAVAAAAPPGANYPITTVIAGYAVGLTDIRLSFLDGENLDSGINGAFNLPSPALLTDIAVKRLRFGCRGELLEAAFDTLTPFTLGYWGCVMTPYAMHFGLPDTGCPDPSMSTMVLGAKVALPALSDQAFTGNLGFKPDGHTVTPADNVVLANGEAITSRMRPPSGMTLKGPGNKTYPFTPVGKGAYLNEFSGAAPPGFVAIPGEINVPFFRNLRVLLNAKSSAGATAASSLDVFAGDSTISLSKYDFFTNANPDPDNSGKGAGLPGPRARRSVFDLIDLDLPLVWNNPLRRFDGLEEMEKDLLLFKMSRRCKSLGPDSAELTFGASAVATSEVMSVSGLFDALDADSSGLLGRIQTFVGNNDVTSALQSLKVLEGLTGDTLDPIFGPALEARLDATAATLYNSLANRYNTVGSAAYKSDVAATNTFFQNAIISTQGEVTALVAGNGGWPLAVRNRLQAGIDTCTKLRALVQSPAKISGIAKALIESGSNPPTTSVTDTLAELDEALAGISTRLLEIQTAFGAGNPMQLLLANSLGNSATVQTWIGLPLLQIQQDWVSGLSDPAGNYFGTSHQAEFVAAFKKAVRSGFTGSSSEQSLRGAIASSVEDAACQLRSGFDGVISAANVAAQSLQPLPFSPVSTLGTIGSAFEGASITGYARINGDSLNELRLDGKLKLKVPDDMTFQTWFLLRDVDGSLPGDACLAAGGVKTEVAAGASAPIHFIGQSVTANAEMRVGIGDSGPLSVAGGIGFKGQLDLQSISVIDPQFGLAIGTADAYVYAKAAGKLNAAAFAMDAEAGFFFGKTCRVDPIAKVNPNVAEFLTTKLGRPLPDMAAPLYGAYAFAYGDFSVLSLIGIPPSCLLDLRVGGGQGFFLFYQPGGSTSAGMQFIYGVRGQVLCLVDVSGRLDGYLAASVANNDVSLSGMNVAGRLIATLRGEIGIDPFSYDWEKAFSVDVFFSPQASPKMTWDLNY